MLAAVPKLRVFAMSLCRNVDRADDLVQETLLRALAHIDSFQAGTNLPAWLFTILRNAFRSEYRKQWREVEDVDGSYAETQTTQPEQESHLDFQDFLTALDKLPLDQREALIVGASGYSYGEAAKICGCAVGAIKTRVNRARIRLAQLLSIECPRDLGIGRKSVLTGTFKVTKMRWHSTLATDPAKKINPARSTFVQAFSEDLAPCPSAPPRSEAEREGN